MKRLKIARMQLEFVNKYVDKENHIEAVDALCKINKEMSKE